MDKTLTYKMVFDSYPDAVTINQMCEMLGGIGVKTAYNLLRSAEIESLCIGRAYRIPKINILKYLNLL